MRYPTSHIFAIVCPTHTFKNLAMARTVRRLRIAQLIRARYFEYVSAYLYFCHLILLSHSYWPKKEKITRCSLCVFLSFGRFSVRHRFDAITRAAQCYCLAVSRLQYSGVYASRIWPPCHSHDLINVIPRVALHLRDSLAVLASPLHGAVMFELSGTAGNQPI